MKHYNCIFTGGSTRGLCYAGVLKALEEFNIEVDIHAGSSIGAIFLTFYALGFTSDEIESEIDNLDLRKLFIDFNPYILSDFAFSKGNIYLKWLREKIESKYYGAKYKKGKMPPVCFKDIDKELIIIATDLKTSNPVILSKETTPNMELALALRITSSMPGLLKPVRYNNSILIDGDILRGRPIWKTTDKLIREPHKLIEFRITGGNKNKLSQNPIKLVNAIVNAAAYNIDSEAEIEYKNYINIIKIDVNNLLFTDFNLSIKRKKQIYKTGYETTMNYFTDKLYRNIKQ